jgi:hypothetical protein
VSERSKRKQAFRKQLMISEKIITHDFLSKSHMVFDKPFFLLIKQNGFSKSDFIDFFACRKKADLIENAKSFHLTTLLETLKLVNFECF